MLTNSLYESGVLNGFLKKCFSEKVFDEIKKAEL